ncbi:uncharacterized protein LOC141913846 [Tubulanus polymorphus]|uniref:uncharacterized protein LOC141913846 n=1 Tax=Tubulanus polymorphus TaxID=672921 RepID=UPI003DA235BE
MGSEILPCLTDDCHFIPNVGIMEYMTFIRNHIGPDWLLLRKHSLVDPKGRWATEFDTIGVKDSNQSAVESHRESLMVDMSQLSATDGRWTTEFDTSRVKDSNQSAVESHRESLMVDMSQLCATDGRMKTRRRWSSEEEKIFHTILHSFQQNGLS